MDNLIYLDNGSTSYPKPDEVYNFMDHFYRNFGGNPGRSGFDLCLEAGEIVEKTRRLLTQYFNGKNPNRLCFSYNSTDALNLVIFGMLKKGAHAVTTTLEHNSVLRPLYHLQKYNGVEVDYIGFDKNGFVDPDDFPKKFKKNTELVVVNHASNVLGTIQPIREIGRYCREAGIPFVIDSSQSAGKIPIDIQDLNVDVVAFTGHKSFLGPTGIGGLYVKEGVKIRHTRAGGTGIRSAERTHLDEYPYRLEYGTLNTLGVAGLYAGLTWVLEKGLDELHRHEMNLIKKLRDGLREVKGVTLYCQNDLNNHISLLLFSIKGSKALDVGAKLDTDFNIACRAGLHCAPLVHQQIKTANTQGAVRFAVGPFNTEEHIEKAVTAVKEIAESQK
ncbi:MAG: aminotransferase class V-fold PLP-dependent enzyme [Candidatus Aminicenantes bacterium]